MPEAEVATTGDEIQNNVKENTRVEVPDDKRVSLAVLPDVTFAQAAHGLKHSDYERYRQYCTKRLSRIRNATQLTNRHGPQSRRYAARSVTVDDVLRDPRALSIPLVLAERDWAAAQAKKRDPVSGPHRTRRTVLSHLRRAATHANDVAKLAHTAGDEHTILEAEAYSQSMCAALALEQEAWSTALKTYEVAQKIYTGMAGVRAGTTGATVYERKLEEIAQAVRFCKYNMARSDGDEDEAAVLQRLRSDAADSAAVTGAADALGARIEAALVEARRRAAQSFGNVSWCGVDVALRSERVREAVLTAEEESKAFSDGKHGVDEYDKLFVALNDAIKVVTDELHEFEKSAGASDARVLELELIQAYLTYNRLQHTIDRNLLLVESLRSRRGSKPEDFVRLFDNLIANVTDILALRGVDGDAAIANNVEARRTLFQAQRCFHLAQCYQAAQLQSEAAALFDRVAVHAKKLTGRYGDEAGRIVHESRGMKSRARAHALLEELELANGVNGVKLENGVNDEKDDAKDTGSSIRNRTMLEHLDEMKSFVETGNATTRTGAHENVVSICHMPPALEAVPCKPVLFDLAIDGVRLPSDTKVGVEKKLPEPKENPALDKTQSAATGFAATRLGRWWSGSGS